MRITTTILTAAAAATLALTLSACGGAASADSDALPQAETTSSAPKAAAEEPAPKASTCDVAREAILTGSKKDIDKALKALVKDKKADADAREAAQDYFETDDKDLKGMSLDLVQMTCSI